jgi:hypothetical protein
MTGVRRNEEGEEDGGVRELFTRFSRDRTMLVVLFLSPQAERGALKEDNR